MAQRDRVQEYFNGLAISWQSKYSAAGTMVPRKPRFESKLRELLSPPARVLDFGCGTGDVTHHIAECGYDVTGCDIAEEMIHAARTTFVAPHLSWQTLDPRSGRWPFEDGCFDAIYSSSVFEYIEDLNLAFAECARVLRLNGVLLITVPNPKNGLRQIEYPLRPLVAVLRALPVPWSARYKSFFEYLRISRNRFGIKKWIRLAEAHGLTCISSDSGRDALSMLAFRRVAEK